MEKQELRIVKKVHKNEKYVAKNGKEYTNVNYYLVIGNSWLAFKPSFSKGYILLDSVAEVLVDDR